MSKAREEVDKSIFEECAYPDLMVALRSCGYPKWECESIRNAVLMQGVVEDFLHRYCTGKKASKAEARRLLKMYDRAFEVRKERK